MKTPNIFEKLFGTYGAKLVQQKDKIIAAKKVVGYLNKTKDKFEEVTGLEVKQWF